MTPKDDAAETFSRPPADPVIDEEVFQGPPPAAVKVDPATGELPAGWRFAD